MYKNVAQLKEDVAGLLTGTNLSNVTNLDGALTRGGRHLAQLIDAPEATGREPVTLYSGVYYYRAPENIFGTAVNLIRPQGNAPAQGLGNVKVPIDVFTRGKFQLPNGYMLDLEYSKGEGIIGITSNLPDQALILSTQNDADEWVNTGTASAPITDTVNFYNPPASIRFNLTGTGTGILTSTIDAVDMSSLEGVGVVFLALMTPDASALTSATVRIGSDSSNYISMSETEGFLGAWQADEWTLVAFDLSSGTETGTPDYSAIAWEEVRLAHDSAIPNVRIGGLWCSMPSIQEIIYQTAAIFKTQAGALSPIITSDNDSIILNPAAYSLLELFEAKTIALQMSGGQVTTQIQGFEMQLKELMERYSANNPSSQLRTIDTYYTDRRGYNTFW